jgi:hypothetical protein
VRALSRMKKQGLDVQHAEGTLESLQADKTALESAFEGDLAVLHAEIDQLATGIEPLELAPKKSNIRVETLELVWIPQA